MSDTDHHQQANNARDLLDHLLRHHHPYTRAALAELAPLTEQVARMHGQRHPELAQLVSLFGQLRDDMEMHLMKEENILFPYIMKLTESGTLTRPGFGTAANPIRVMRAEHDADRALLLKMLEITHDFALPAYACASFTALYRGLHALVKDLLQHMDLENNRLFPLVLEMEKARLGTGERQAAVF